MEILLATWWSRTPRAWSNDLDKPCWVAAKSVAADDPVAAIQHSCACAVLFNSPAAWLLFWNLPPPSIPWTSPSLQPPKSSKTTTLFLNLFSCSSCSSSSSPLSVSVSVSVSVFKLRYLLFFSLLLPKHRSPCAFQNPPTLVNLPP